MLINPLCLTGEHSGTALGVRLIFYRLQHLMSSFSPAYGMESISSSGGTFLSKCGQILVVISQSLIGNTMAIVLLPNQDIVHVGRCRMRKRTGRTTICLLENPFAVLVGSLEHVHLLGVFAEPNQVIS